LAADLVGRKVDVIVATGGAPSSLGLRPLRCQIDLFSRLLRVFLSQRVQRVTRCKSQVQKEPKHHWPLRGEAVFSPTEAAAEPAAPGIAPVPPHDRSGRLKPNADGAALVDEGTLGGNPPDDILRCQYRRHRHHLRDAAGQVLTGIM
jgi:hypothetical protein